MFTLSTLFSAQKDQNLSNKMTTSLLNPNESKSHTASASSVILQQLMQEITKRMQVAKTMVMEQLATHCSTISTTGEIVIPTLSTCPPSQRKQDDFKPLNSKSHEEDKTVAAHEVPRCDNSL